MMLLTAADRKALPKLYTQDGQGFKGRMGLGIERDRHFSPTPLKTCIAKGL